MLEQLKLTQKLSCNKSPPHRSKLLPYIFGCSCILPFMPHMRSALFAKYAICHILQHTIHLRALLQQKPFDTYEQELATPNLQLSNRIQLLSNMLVSALQLKVHKLK